jgi:hypothetical protein
MFTLGAVLGLWSLHVTKRGWVFLLLCGAAVFGGTGALYTAFGARCIEWDARFVSRFDPNRLSGWQALVLGVLGMSVCALWIWFTK